MDFERSGEIYWKRINDEEPWIVHASGTGELFQLTADEKRLKRRRDPDKTYLNYSRPRFRGILTVLWKSLDRFLTVHECNRKIIYLKEVYRSYSLV